MEYPKDLRYSDQHEWARREGDLVRVGITDFAQDALGDVVYAEVPDVGTQVQAGEPFGEVESTKSVSDVYAPVSGAIVEVNQSLTDNPAQINDDPYGDGWMVVIQPSDPSEWDRMLDAAAYRALTDKESGQE